MPKKILQVWLVFSSHLHFTLQELHYENYRSEKLAKSRLAGGAAAAAKATTTATTTAATPPPPPPTAKVKDAKENLLLQKEEEIRRMKEMMERLQAELQQEKDTPPTTPNASRDRI